MFCPMCGAPNEDDGVFCGNCGASLNPDEAPLEAVAEAVADAPADAEAVEEDTEEAVAEGESTEIIEEAVVEPVPENVVPAPLPPEDVSVPPPPPPAAPPPPPPAPAAPQTVPTSGLAIASLVLGVGGLTLLPLLGSVLALILGYMARKEIRQRPDELTGDGLALAGIVMGWIAVGLGVLLLVAAGGITVCALCGAFGYSGY